MQEIFLISSTSEAAYWVGLPHLSKYEQKIFNSFLSPDFVETWKEFCADGLI